MCLFGLDPACDANAGINKLPSGSTGSPSPSGGSSSREPSHVALAAQEHPELCCRGTCAARLSFPTTYILPECEKAAVPSGADLQNTVRKRSEEQRVAVHTLWTAASGSLPLAYPPALTDASPREAERPHAMMVPKVATVPAMEPIFTPPPPSKTKTEEQRSAEQPSRDTLQPRRPSRPDNARSSTDPSPAPSPSLFLQGYMKDKDTLPPWARPGSSHRNRSPYSRSHLRSRSSGAVAGLPPMTRAHSMPSPHMPKPFADTPAQSSGSLSPSPSTVSPSPGGRTLPVRTRSPFKTGEEGKSWMDGGVSLGAAGPGIESIQEDSESDFSGSQSQLVQPAALHAARVPSLGGRRRPASPLSQQQSQTSPTSFPNATAGAQDHTAIRTPPPLSGSSSPALGPQKEKYNEAYPPTSFTPAHALNHHSSTSSITSMNSLASLNSFTSYPSHPSTPTSARSRSPSISSLDTIEDEPEMEAIERLKEAADAEDSDGEKRRSSLDGPRPVVGFGFTRGRSERKRWSVCGGERRADLDLETIWED